MKGMEGLTAGSGFRGDGNSGTRKAAVGNAAVSPATNPEPRDPAAANGGTSPSEGARGKAIVRRELITLAVALVFGFVLVPLATWVVGNRILGPYTHLQDPTAGTGAMRLLADFYEGLAHGSVVFWWVGLGPYVLLCLVRLIWTLLRRDLGRDGTAGV